MKEILRKANNPTEEEQKQFEKLLKKHISRQNIKEKMGI